MHHQNTHVQDTTVIICFSKQDSKQSTEGPESDVTDTTQAREI